MAATYQHGVAEAAALSRANSYLRGVFFSSRRRHTRYWRDWSSDVCSSDLPVGIGNGVVYSANSQAGVLFARDAATGSVLNTLPLPGPTFGGISLAGRAVYVAVGKIGRASCRERV